MKNLTIFSAPKPFEGHIGVIQRNAIQSWIRLHPQCEVILFGNETGIAEAARICGAKHIVDIKRNRFGTPLINNLFQQAEKEAVNNLLCYVNTDIILMSDFMTGLSRISELIFFLMIGQRWDLDINSDLGFDPVWEKELNNRIRTQGKLHPPTGMDYFAYKAGTWSNIPPFTVGRPMWDNWMIYAALARRIPVIDATRVVTVVHQNHEYGHRLVDQKGVWRGEEVEENKRLAGSEADCFTALNANYILTDRGLEKPNSSFARLARKLDAWLVLRPDYDALRWLTWPLRKLRGFIRVLLNKYRQLFSRY